jgi:hypothetical protein
VTPQLTIVFGSSVGFLYPLIGARLIDLPLPADTGGVTRGLGLLLALLSLATVGGLLAAQGKNQGPTSAAVTQAESQAIATAASAVFSPVDQMLQVDDSQTGTYVGAELPVGSGVNLVRATATSYCLEADLSGTPVHENGPGGSPAVGSC